MHYSLNVTTICQLHVTPNNNSHWFICKERFEIPIKVIVSIKQTSVFHQGGWDPTLPGFINTWSLVFGSNCCTRINLQFLLYQVSGSKWVTYTHWDIIIICLCIKLVNMCLTIILIHLCKCSLIFFRQLKPFCRQC